MAELYVRLELLFVRNVSCRVLVLNGEFRYALEMLQAYFESIKYVGHLLPVSFLRIFLGYFYLDLAVKDWKTYLSAGNSVSELFLEALNKPIMPGWYRILLSEQIIPHWNVIAFIVIGLQFAVGISYIL